MNQPIRNQFNRFEAALEGVIQVESAEDFLKEIPVKYFRRLVQTSILTVLATCMGCLDETDGTFSAKVNNSDQQVVVNSDPSSLGLLSEGEILTPIAVEQFTAQSVRSSEQRLGTVFEDSSIRWKLAPEITEIQLPEVDFEHAIWGATGRDDYGNVYFGISCFGDEASAALCRLSPGRESATFAGDTLANLRRLRIASESMTQMKIHTKPVQGDDGYVYFASMDEQGETEDGSRLPIYGSNLWRVPVSANQTSETVSQWEHLLAIPEAIIATGCTGRYVYALGYYQHILYQYDTETAAVQKIQVGSSGGHISRNLIVDLEEHAYVPRVILRGEGNYIVQLIEYDDQMKEVASHPIDDYGATSDFSSHGITGFAFLKNGDCLFTTSKGALYRLRTNGEKPSSVERLGWFHPKGESYASFLCSPDGELTLCGIATCEGETHWVVYDLEQWRGEVIALKASAQNILGRDRVLFYGSNTRDDDGSAFVTGWHYLSESNRYLPYAAHVRWPEQ